MLWLVTNSCFNRLNLIVNSSGILIVYSSGILTARVDAAAMRRSVEASSAPSAASKTAKVSSSSTVLHSSTFLHCVFSLNLLLVRRLFAARGLFRLPFSLAVLKVIERNCFGKGKLIGFRADFAQVQK